MRVIVAEIVAEMPGIAHRQNVFELESHVPFLVNSTGIKGRAHNAPIMIYTRESRPDSGLWKQQHIGEKLHGRKIFPENSLC